MTTKLHALARLTLAGACAAVGFLCVGCEKPEAQADKRVKSYIADSQDKAAAKDRNPTEFTRKDFKYADFLKIVEEGQTKAHTLLQQASMESLASAPARITAKTRLAESNFARASAMLSGITAKEAQLAALIVNIESLSLTIAGNNARLAVLNGANPEKVSAGEGKPALEPRKAYEGGKKTQTEEVAKADKEIAEATKAVEELTAEVKKLDEQRSAAIKDATDKMVQSEQIRGKDAVKLYNESVARRKESQDLEQQLAVRNVELSRQQMRLAQVQQTKKLAEAAVTRAQVQITAVDERWTKTKTLIAQVEAANKLALDGTDKEPGLAARAAEIAKLAAEVDKQRAEADKYYEAAAAGYGEAGDTAKKLYVAIQTTLRDQNYQDSPTKRALAELQTFYVPHIFALAQGRASQSRGMLYVNQKLILDAQKRAAVSASAALTAAGLAIPADLAKPTLQQDLESADKSAKQHLDTADKLLAAVAESDSSATRKLEASVHRIGAQYTLYRLSADKSFLEEARKQLTNLRDERKEVALPSFPEELETGIITRSTMSAAPAPTSTTPTTPPAVEATTPPTTAPADPTTIPATTTPPANQ